MESRRDFLKKAALLSGAVTWGSVPESIQRALAIDPETGSSYLDAEHVVILMQENRSFDHCYGTLSGVRGYNDPRVHLRPDLKPVWLQTNADGDSFVPFRLDIKETNATWMGSLPHSWDNQVDARNGGRYDKWLIAKPTDYQGYTKMPMTLGHYTREDIPFYYAFADAFTVCDQHFCSSLTGTTPNRLYLWTGTIREKPSPDSKPRVFNEEADYDTEVGWTTCPERLEDAGISWKIYQNEVSLDTGFQGEEESWLSNFTDNPIEFFKQYNVRFLPRYRAYLEKREKELTARIAQLEHDEQTIDGTAQAGAERAKKLDGLRGELKDVKEVRQRWSQERFDSLSAREKNLHAKAFTTNEGDPHFRELEVIKYHDGTTERQVPVPKGDVFHQFREDVQNGTLPTVSWLVGPENFSDHPSAAWYGAWYVSEALDILTKNPEVWKKTIFILTYDENDGYFDHVPPFTAPDPARPETGKVSPGIDAAVEYVTLEQDRAFRPTYPPRDSSIGLGFRVPFVVASPWSRGGCVCSQVFDHTSVLQFLEHLLTHRTGRKIEEPNISSWRRTVCGDLTSIFQPYHGEPTITPPFPPRDEFIEGIHRARFKNPPGHCQPVSAASAEEVTRHLPAQEKGTRRSCPLPYELYVDGRVNDHRLEILFRVGHRFGGRSAGSPFNVSAYRSSGDMQVRAYAVSAGDEVSDSWLLSEFEGGTYHVRVDGPNGFLREFKGSPGDPAVELAVAYKGRKLEITVLKGDGKPHELVVSDLSYGGNVRRQTVSGRGKIVVDTQKSHGWYDLEVRLAEGGFSRRLAGRIETGEWSITDPAMA